VSGLVLIGSRERSSKATIETADEHSDWDFHVITANPSMFLSRDWTEEILGSQLKAYATRSAIISGVPKVGLVFSDAEVDLVIISEKLLRGLKLWAAFGMHRRSGPSQRRMQDIAEVIRPGWRFLKGERRWGALYRRAVSEVADPRLSNAALKNLAEGFVCDFVWTKRKMARGEFRTAQRMLHRELAEVNFQLLHELRQRQGKLSFTKARRLELITSATELDKVTVEATLAPACLHAAIDKCAATCRELMADLVGANWRWPI